MIFVVLLAALLVLGLAGVVLALDQIKRIAELNVREAEALAASKPREVEERSEVQSGASLRVVVGAKVPDKGGT